MIFPCGCSSFSIAIRVIADPSMITFCFSVVWAKTFFKIRKLVSSFPRPGPTTTLVAALVRSATRASSVKSANIASGNCAWRALALISSVAVVTSPAPAQTAAVDAMIIAPPKLRLPPIRVILPKVPLKLFSGRGVITSFKIWSVSFFTVKTPYYFI